MKHVELMPDERALIAAARDGAEPTPVQRARVRRTLDAKIAAGVTAPVLATSAGLATLLKVGAGLAVAAALGGGAVYLAGPRASVAPASPPPSSARIPRPAPIPTPALAPAAAPVPPAAPVSPPAEVRSSPARGPAHRRGPATASDAPVDLAGELALLGQASAATRQGDVVRADALLRAYDERFPSGQLAQERAAAGVLAHCAGSRMEQARAEARRFLARWPRSPLVARIQGSCAGEDNSP